MTFVKRRAGPLSRAAGEGGPAVANQSLTNPSSRRNI